MKKDKEPVKDELRPEYKRADFPGGLVRRKYTNLKTTIPRRTATQQYLGKGMKAKLTKEEKGILDSFEKGDWVPVAGLSKRKKELIAYARNTLRKDKRLNIRISERDLLELQRRAVKEGLPYQTYISSLIHKSGYAVCSTTYHMLRLATYNHFAWHRATIYGLLHQTVEE